MTKKLILFPDTNLFIQCKPLKEINWSLFGDFSEIDLIVSRPVQVEIDRQKSKGSGRLAKRARTTASQLNEVLDAEENFVLITNGQPKVKLFLKIELKADLSLAEQLNYEERDDQLVGIASAYAKNNTDLDVRVITGDSGPKASAKTVGVKCETICEEWFLPPETDEIDKKIIAIQAKLTKYENAEPSFELITENSEGIHEIFKATLIRYPALDDNQVLLLMNRIESSFPETNNFGCKNSLDFKTDAAKRADVFGLYSAMNPTKEFVPASESEIIKYRHEHSEWLSKCGDYLRDLHIYLHAQSDRPKLDVKLRNKGTRPAENVLITLTALGKFKIKPPSVKEDKAPKFTVKFTSPPRPPTGVWREKYSGLIEALRTNNGSIIANIPTSYQDLGKFRQPTRDAETFYYKPDRPSIIVKEFSLECVRWRHLLPAESFETEIYIKLEDGDFTGALEVTIHASNMTIPVKKIVQICIEVRQGNTIEEANRLIEQLDKPNTSRFPKNFSI